MDSAHVGSWVMQQYREIGFGEGGRGPFIGKKALKEKLISKYPTHKTRIRQLVNAIKHHDTPPRTAPASKPVTTLSQTKKMSQPPAQLTSSSKSVANTKSSSNPKIKQAPSGSGSKLNAARSQDSDSGFASGPEEAENCLNIDTWRPGKTSAVNSQFHSPSSEIGGARLDAFLSTVSTSGKPAETSKTTETILSSLQEPSNLKIRELKKFLDEVEGSDLRIQGQTEDTSSTLDLQLGLLHLDSVTNDVMEESSITGIENAVLFSGDVLESFGQNKVQQYGLLGSFKSRWSTTTSDSRIFLNTNIPFSAFVCGVQGSGKSHTTACMIENCLIPSPVLGVLQKPTSALVFNFAEYASGSTFRPCELAFLASPSSRLPGRLSVKNVNVLVSPSNYLPLKALYEQIPGVKIQPFMLRPKDLNISVMLTLMAVDQTHAAPLYMGVVTKILRNMASETAESFNYPEFRRRLDDAGLDRKQVEFLNQRLDLLESFLDLNGSTINSNFAAGEITIIDLSCPFVDSSTACVLFKIGMDLYLESDPTIGKVIVLDEAHKYMTDAPASKALTESLMGVIRQQRHYGARVIISTQEPSISPKLIDLCSITVMHRFSSPEWLDVLRRHILVVDEEGDRDNKVGLLREIMRLKTGEALVFAPLAILETRDEAREPRNGTDKLLKMRMRKRITWDGGRSVVCV